MPLCLRFALRVPHVSTESHISILPDVFHLESPLLGTHFFFHLAQMFQQVFTLARGGAENVTQQDSVLGLFLLCFCSVSDGESIINLKKKDGSSLNFGLIFGPDYTCS